MVIVNTLEGQARVRLYIKDKNLYLTRSLSSQKFLEGKNNRFGDIGKVSWWEIHPVEAGKPEKGYRFSNDGFYISTKITEVLYRSPEAIELVKDEADAVILYARALSESSTTFVLTSGIDNHSSRALSLTARGDVGIYHLLLPNDETPIFQHFIPKGNLQPLPYKIGDLIGGGIVFWVNEDGSEGRVVALEDQDNESNWSEAKELCENLELNGFSDWYAPSVTDLKYMEFNLDNAGLGDFNQEKPYWSSKAHDKTHAWTFKFKDHGIAIAHHKVNLYNVRAVRDIKAE